jgi:hypothetical protein
MESWGLIGKLLLFIGIGTALLGGALMLGARLAREDGIPWLGRLPGDIRIERKGLSCYFPLATSVLISLLLTIILNIVVRLLRRQ